MQAGDPQLADTADDVDILVPGPADGASQTEILQGFITAALSPRNNYQRAREFLTPDFADEWQAGAGATIDVLGDRELVPVDETRATAPRPRAALSRALARSASSRSRPMKVNSRRMRAYLSLPMKRGKRDPDCCRQSASLGFPA